MRRWLVLGGLASAGGRCPVRRLHQAGVRAASVAALALGVTLVVVTPAGATTTASLSGTTLEIVAGPESNNLSFGGNSLLQQYVEDTTGITPGPGCAAVETTKVICPDFGSGLPDFTQVVVHLGDGDDVIAAGIVSVPMTIYAEGGNDTVFAGDGNDTVYGGDGNDEMTGNPGSDIVDGGPGDDTLRGGSGNDHVIGGPGRDNVDGDGPEVLDDGNDQLDINDGELDQAQCGFGADIVTADALDAVDALSCEVIHRAVTPKVSVRGPSRIRISSLLASGYRFRAGFTEAGSFKGVLYLTSSQARKLRIGTKGVNLASAQGTITNATRAVTLRVVNQRYRTALRRVGRVNVSLLVAAAGPSGSDSLSRSVVLVR